LQLANLLSGKAGEGAYLSRYQRRYAGYSAIGTVLIQNIATKQTGSRLGGTGAWHFSKHQSVKISYSDGTYIRFGGNYQNVSVAWQAQDASTKKTGSARVFPYSLPLASTQPM
jgi:hypothetical protein